MDISKQNPCILQALPALKTGGVERGTVDLAIYAKNKGVKVIVASNGGKLVEKLESNGIEHFALNLKTKNPFKIILNIFKLKSLCKKNNVKIIHARSRAPAWSAYYAAKQLNLPFITTYHGFYKNNFPGKKCYNSIMAKGDEVIAVSDFIREHIFDTYHTDPKKVVLIHRGVDMNEFDPEKISEDGVKAFKEEKFLPLGAPIILLPGRITRWKGQNIAIKAAAELKDKKFILAFAGGAEKGSKYMDELLALIKKHKIEDKVRFLGDINNMPLAYAASDIVLSTSIEPETFGRVSTEAGAMGKMVIATNIGGSKEIIADGRTGYLVPPKDHKELAKKIDYALTLLSDEKNRQQIAYDCRKHILENFSLQNMCERTLSLYQQKFIF